MMKIGIDKTLSIIMRPIYQSVLLALALLLTACSSEIDELQPTTGQHTSVLLMEGGIERFDESTSVNDVATRAAVIPWNDGARLYVQFQTSKGLVSGTAVFNKKTDSWYVTYNGTLTQGQTTKCEVYYFETPAATTSSAVTLSPQTAVYADASATYFFNDGVVTLQAHLKSLTGRVRFRGEVGYVFTVNGLKSYQGYTISSNTLSTQESPLQLTVGNDGYTPYVYAVFADVQSRTLVISNNSDEYVFSKDFNSSVLSTGKSGYIRIPTKDEKRGWTVVSPKGDLTFTVKGNDTEATFTMKRVEPGTFMMGRAGTADVSTPVHTVTLTKAYYIGETEVTQALWYAVMGESPTSTANPWDADYGLGENYPAYRIRYTDCVEFISKLNQLTGENFRLPTEAEWEFAAKGGTQSKGYTYAGSNNLADVGWYVDNSTTTKTQRVGLKAPNELGLYDMSGNVWEWCQDWYGEYSNSAQTDPTGPTTGTHRIDRGGGWFNDAVSCTVANRYANPPSDRSGSQGLRLAL